MRQRLRPIALVTGMVLLAACVTDNRPTDCDDRAVAVELTLTENSLAPSDPAVCRDQEVTLRIAAEADGVLHIHGYDEAAPATEVTNGEELELSFTAERAGQFPIEFHPADDPEGVSVGILTVHEP